MVGPDAKPTLKTAFKNLRSIAPLYTSGPVALTSDGTKIITCVAEEIICTAVSTGKEICRFLGDTQTINSLCITPSTSHLLAFTASISLRIYPLPDGSAPVTSPVHPLRVVAKAHDAPVHVCKSDPTSTYLASGSADGVVKVWNIFQGYITHVFKGHGGIISALVFNYPQDFSSVDSGNRKMELITASADTRIRIFDLSGSGGSGAGKPQAVLEGHVSVPRGLGVSSDGKWLVSGGRDAVVLVWDLASRNSSKTRSDKGKHKAVVPKLVKTIPVLERVEAVGILGVDDITGSSSTSQKLRIYTGGEKGIIKVWDAIEGATLFTFGSDIDSVAADTEDQRQILDVIYIPLISTVVSIHADQNILFHSLSTRTLTRQLIGFNDEVVDVKYLTYFSDKDSHLAIATNSSLIRVYSVSDFDARLLDGHSDIVLALDHSPDGRLLASGSKDKTARLWAPIPLDDSALWNYTCIAVCEGHAESVGAIALSRVALPADGNGPRGKFMFTGSQDKTIKMWDLSGIASMAATLGDQVRCRSLSTHKAHEKDINSLDVSPNDKLLVSGSQDRTIKVYEIEYATGTGNKAPRGEIKLVGTCKGHKRGVWSVRFSRSERVLASGSGDKSVKLWSLDDFSCLKTFEGHTNAVLRVDFMNCGMQLVSAASDGLIKLWNIREEEYTVTLDNHEDKVWALAISADEQTIVSGAADSVITFWGDCTEEQQQEKEKRRNELVLHEQDFQNYVSLHNYRKAIQLALAMEQPGRLYSLFKELQLSEEHSYRPGHLDQHGCIAEVILTLTIPDLAKLLRYVRDWNTNAKTSLVAQALLYAITKLRSSEDLIQAFQPEPSGNDLSFSEEVGISKRAAAPTGGGIKEIIDALIPYTERHLARIDRLVQESYMVDYMLGEMDDGIFDNEVFDEMEIDHIASI